jgi:hypothetical protein
MRADKKIMHLKSIFLLFAAVALTGCLGTESYTDQHFAATDPSKIEVVDLHQIQHKYEIVGSVSCNTEFGNVKYLRQQASKLGADAISIPTHIQADVIESQAIKYKD